MYKQIKLKTFTLCKYHHGLLIPILLAMLTGTVHGHGTDGHQLDHESYDAYLASIARAEEQRGAVVVTKFLNQSFSNLPVNVLLTEIVDATLGKQVNAADGGSLYLYGQWSPLTTWPFVFASAANLPDGRILAWGANNTKTFTGGTFTYGAIWNPGNGEFVTANHATHATFCGMPVMLEDGQVFVDGGDTANSSSVKGTSTFDFRTGNWTRLQNLAVGRWYNGTVALPNGKVFSALGEPGSVYPEIWTEGTGWSYLNGINFSSSVYSFPKITEFNHWLPHLHLAPNGKIFHSGHSPQMNYIDVTGNGSIFPVGLSNEWVTAHSPSILYDEGKILQTGGRLFNGDHLRTTKSQLFDLNGNTPTRTLNTDMHYPRMFHNEVVLPNGEVMVIGGSTSPGFSDVGSQMTPEIWNPETKIWKLVADIAAPRNYHSVALLMTDGKVWSGGGGLCDCSGDHPDSQVFSPPYLFNVDGSLATRPEITQAPDIVSYGVTTSVTASPGIKRFTMIRMSSTTHAVNTDMRFLNVPFIETGLNQYALTFHSNRDVMVPGYWMLFALDDKGVPSVSKVIKVSSSNSPVLTNPSDQNTIQNNIVNLAVQARDPNGDPLTFNAVGLPQGLTINPTSGFVTGIPSVFGSSRVVVSVTDGSNTASTSFIWNITSNQILETSSLFGSIGGASFTDSVGPNQSLRGVNVRHAFWLESIQGILNTGGIPQHGGSTKIPTSVTWPTDEYLVRIFGLYGNYVGQISFVTNTGRVLGPYGTAESGNNTNSFDFTIPIGKEIVGFSGRADTNVNALGVVYRTRQVVNQPPLIRTIPNQISYAGTGVSFTAAASDPDGDTLTYSASGLPAGITIDSATGVISGVPTTTANHDVIVQVRDARDASSAINFEWAIYSPALVIVPISTSPQSSNTPVSFTATVNNGVGLRYKWSFGDNSAEIETSTPEIVHTFTSPGLFVVRVTVTDSRGVSNSETFIQAIHLPQTLNRPTLSSNLAVSSSNGTNRLWVVNQDNDSVSVFNSNTDTKITEIAVGKSPRSIAVAPDGRIWISNKANSSLSIVNPTTLQLQQTINLPPSSQPFGLAFAPDGSAGYVALEAAGKLLKFDPVSGATITSLTIGSNPRHIAIQNDSNKILVSRYISPPLPGESSATIQTNGPQGNYGGEIFVVNAGTMTVDKTIVLQNSDKQDTVNQGAGIPNYLAMVAISPDGKTAWVPSKQDNIKRGMLRSGQNLNFQNTVRAITSRLDLTTFTENYDARIDYDNSGIASAVTFDLSGSYLFVALETSREVAVVDAYGGRELRRIPVGLAPDGLAISPDGQKLYVNNFMDRSVSVVDLSNLLSRGDWLAPVSKTLSSVTTEKLNNQVLKGKQLFYDAKDLRLASDSYISCATCHNDGGHDGRVWDLTGFGEGLRNTIALQGRSGISQGFLHWSGNFDEIQDFEGQIRNLAGGTGLMTDADFVASQNTLGLPKAGRSADLDALAAYVNSLSTFQKSPNRNSDGSLTADAVAGKALFTTAGCTKCHGSTPFTDSPARIMHNIGTIKPASGQRLNAALTGLDTPTLRDVWNTAPYLHDGSAKTLLDAIRMHNTVALTDSQITQLVSYVDQIDGTELALANQPTTISLTSPKNTESVVRGTPINIVANAVDMDSDVVKVEFYVGNTLLATDNAAPYNFNWTTASLGNFVLTAKTYDNYGLVNTSAGVSISVVNQGLQGKYFNNTTLTGTPVLQRNEVVDFSWSTSSPGTGVNTDNFSIRWSGQLTSPITGTYRLRTTNDDGVRLYINGVRQINNWTDHTKLYNSTTSVSLIAGVKYNIVMEYYDRTGMATAKLLWATPQNSSFTIIPISQLSNIGN